MRGGVAGHGPIPPGLPPPAVLFLPSYSERFGLGRLCGGCRHAADSITPAHEEAARRSRVDFKDRPLGWGGGCGGWGAVGGGVRVVRLQALGAGFRSALQEL